MAHEHNPYDTDGNAIAEKERESPNLSEKAHWESVLRWVMGHRRGREFVNQLLKDAKVDKGVFNANALWMSSAAGLQEWGINLREAIKRVALEEYFTMLREHGVA